MYRYSAKSYNKALLNMGCIRVGTLHDFRKSEHKRGIADPQEGKKEVFHHIDNAFFDINDDNSMHSRAAKEFRFIKGVGQVHCENVTFAMGFNEPDCYILCISSKQSQFVMDQFEGADTCIEIINPRLFYHQLTLALNDITPVIFRGVHEAIYQNKKEPWNGINWGHHPALVKEPEFTDQYELRAIWQPRISTQIEPVILGSHELGRACQEITIKSNPRLSDDSKISA